MFWEIKKDLISLFKRDKDGNYLDPIDGIRSIASLLIILSHLVAIFSSFVVPYPNKEWDEYLKSVAFGLNTIMSFSLEIFLMLSSFLLTHKLITEWNSKRELNLKLFVLKEYPLSILKRAFRLWPGLFLSSLILFVYGEPRYPNSGYLFEFFRHLNVWMFFQNYINVEYWYMTFVPLWSISLDMQIHIILPLFLYLFYCKRSLLSLNKSLLILLLLSIIRGIIVFDPVKMSLLTITYRYPSLPLLSPSHLITWLKNDYNLTFSFDIPEVNAGKLFMHKMYLPLEARFGSFIIGSMLSIQLIQSSNNQNLNNNKFQRLKKYLINLLICFHLLTLISSPSMPPSPSNLMMKLLISSSRQLFTLGQSFVLFSALCPQSHPYHSKWIRKFLSLSIWIPISKLSYFVYLIHWRISFELIYSGPLNFLKNCSVTSASLICLPVILLLTQFISSIWFVLFDKPIQRAIQFYFLTTRSVKNRMV